MAKHTLEDVEKHGRDLYQPFATAGARLRDLKAKQQGAHADKADKAGAAARAESALEAGERDIRPEAV